MGQASNSNRAHALTTHIGGASGDVSAVGLWYRQFLAFFYYHKCNMPWCNVLLARFERAVKNPVMGQS